MAAPPSPFTALRQRHEVPPVGTWLMSGAASTAEAMGCCGFDFLVVDTEHVPVGIAQTVDLLRAVDGTGAVPLVRLAWNDQVIVKQTLDAGARNLMFPFVQDAEEARRAVAYTRYPPEGVRGVAAIHRASRYGQTRGYLAGANAEIRVVVQLETPEAIGNLAAIAAVPGVDALFVGPGDLSAAMGHLGDIVHADVQDALRRAAESAHEHGKPVGIVGPNPAMVGRFVEYGYDFVAIASDIAMMTARANEFLAAVRRREAPAPASAGPY